MTNTEAPPDLMAHTRDRMAELAADSAKNAAERKIRSMIKGYLPKFLWPLIPGERGTVAGNVKSGVSKWFWGLVSSAVISLIFLAIFGVAILGVAGVIAYALITS
ncbi:MAG: hypothetical protein KC621_16800 [Myxococcales bacterium]|nr:hypothetical protein [Myxococcales bacterium]